MAMTPEEKAARARQRMNILGVDPGPTESSGVLWDGKQIVMLTETEPAWLVHRAVAEGATVAIEDFVVYRTLDQHGRETIKAIGAIRQECRRQDVLCVEIPRAEVLQHIVGHTKGGDVALRAAITDRFGGSREAAWGTKKSRGPLFGLTGSHLLAALGVAITAFEKHMA